jgi:hypothetical protein
MFNLLRSFREPSHSVRPTRGSWRSTSIEGLEERCFLSAGLGPSMAGHAAQVQQAHDIEHGGTVVQRPAFYEDYTGPRFAQLEAVQATGTLLRDGSFRFTGVNRRVIDPGVTATYVFGVDRSGALPTGQFPDRPNIRFDATVVVKLVPGKSPAITVTDLAKKSTATLPDSTLRNSGRSLTVVVPGNLLPSTGLSSSQFRYNFWPEDGLPGSTNIASFAPKTHDIRVGVQHGS